MFSRIVWSSMLAAAMAALGFVYEGSAGAVPPSARQNVGTEDACIAVLDGGEFPQFLPTFFVWEQAWADAVSVPELQGQPLARGIATHGLDERTLTTLRDVGEKARQRAAALREASIAPGLPGDLATDRDIAAAEAIFAGRDELIRSLPVDRYRDVERGLQESRRELKYRFPVQGRVRRDAIVGDLCVVTIKGKDYPHLIPEAYAWEFYFRVRALGASSERTGEDSYSDIHLSTVQRVDIPIAKEHILHLLRVATATNAAVDRLREAESSGHAGPHEVVQEQLARLVLDARDDLVRTLPPKAWLAVQADVMRRMGGTVFDFPARVQP